MGKGKVGETKGEQRSTSREQRRARRGNNRRPLSSSPKIPSRRKPPVVMGMIGKTVDEERVLKKKPPRTKLLSPQTGQTHQTHQKETAPELVTQAYPPVLTGEAEHPALVTEKQENAESVATKDNPLAEQVQAKDIPPQTSDAVVPKQQESRRPSSGLSNFFMGPQKTDSEICVDLARDSEVENTCKKLKALQMSMLRITSSQKNVSRELIDSLHNKTAYALKDFRQCVGAIWEAENQQEGQIAQNNVAGLKQFELMRTDAQCLQSFKPNLLSEDDKVKEFCARNFNRSQVEPTFFLYEVIVTLQEYFISCLDKGTLGDPKGLPQTVALIRFLAISTCYSQSENLFAKLHIFEQSHSTLYTAMDTTEGRAEALLNFLHELQNLIRYSNKVSSIIKAIAKETICDKSLYQIISAVSNTLTQQCSSLQNLHKIIAGYQLKSIVDADNHNVSKIFCAIAYDYNEQLVRSHYLKDGEVDELRVFYQELQNKVRAASGDKPKRNRGKVDPCNFFRQKGNRNFCVFEKKRLPGQGNTDPSGAKRTTTKLVGAQTSKHYAQLPTDRPSSVNAGVSATTTTTTTQMLSAVPPTSVVKNPWQNANSKPAKTTFSWKKEHRGESAEELQRKWTDSSSNASNREFEDDSGSPIIFGEFEGLGIFSAHKTAKTAETAKREDTPSPQEPQLGQIPASI